MFSQNPRSKWLVLFAAGNLVVWTAIAVAIGLIASDVVDLGLETFVRDTQVTAVAAWGRVSSPGSVAAEEATRQASPPGEEPAEKVAAIGTPEVVWPDGVVALAPGSDSAAASGSDTESSQQSPEQVSGEPPEDSTPQVTATPLGSPLLLADPGLGNIEAFSVEMNRSALGRPVQIRYSEDGLNQEITVLLANDPNLPYRNVQIDLRSGYAVVSATATVLGFQVRTVVEGTLVAQDCVPVVEIQSVSMGGVFTPHFVKGAIEDMIAEAMTWYPADYPLCLEQIVLEENRATVYGHRR